MSEEYKHKERFPELKNWLNLLLRIFASILVGTIIGRTIGEMIQGTFDFNELFQFVIVCIITVLWFIVVINSFLEYKRRIKFSNKKNIKFEEKEQ